MRQLEIDAGNTFVKWRLRDNREVIQEGRLLTAQVRDGDVQPPPVWGQAEQAKVASVAGDAVHDWLVGVLVALDVCVDFVQVSAQRYGLKNAYEQPLQMGVDRWVAMLAAWQQTRQGVCVVDAGSAVTVDFVDTQGQHLGGYIMPGLRLLQDSLLGSTAGVRWSKLPEDYSLLPGSSTAACVYNGGYYLLAALLQRVKMDCAAYGIDHIILTGGDATELYRQSQIGRLQESLVLDGLQWFGEG
jgi:type III pantothenate kinase